jgi:hypothetical protein
MSVDISIKLNDHEARLKVGKITDNFGKNIRKSVMRALLYLEGRIDLNLRNGKFNIKSRTGAAGLAGSMESTVIGSGLSFVGKLTFNKVYAKIQEKGGRINVTDRMSKFAWFKYFQTNEVMWKAIALKKGGQITIPAHFFAKLTLKEESRKMLQIIEDGLLNG